MNINVGNIAAYMTLTMSVTILFIFCVKIVFEKKLSPKFNLMLWLLLLVRIAFPLLPESPTSIFNVLDVPEVLGSAKNAPEVYSASVQIEAPEEKTKLKDTEFAYETADSYSAPDIGEDMEDMSERESSNDATGIPRGYIPVYQSGISKNENGWLPGFLVCIYFAGLAAVCAFSMRGYKDVKKKLLEAAWKNENEDFMQAYQNALEITGLKNKKHPVLYTGNSSVLIGIIKPVIVIDRCSTPEEAYMIILHELNHYKNLDNFYLLVSSVICCVFWFNPLVWTAHNSLRFDLELFCDYKTLSNGKIKKDEYAALLFSRVEGRNFFTPISEISSAGRQLKLRIKSIVRIKNEKYLPKIVCAALAFAICALCLTNPIVSQNGNKKVYTENFISLTGYSQKLPDENSKVTAEQFYGMILSAIGSFDLSGEECESFARALGEGDFSRFMKNASEIFSYDENAEKFLNDNIRGDTVLTREKAAFILDMAMNLKNLGEQKIPEHFGGTEFLNIISSLSEDDKNLIVKYYEKYDLRFHENSALGDTLRGLKAEMISASESGGLEKMSRILGNQKNLEDYIEEISVKYVLREDTPLSVKLKLYNILKNNGGQNSFLSGIIDESKLYSGGYIAKIDIIVFEEEILPFIADADDFGYIVSLYEYDNEGYYINTGEPDKSGISRIYDILASALNANGNSTLKKQVQAENDGSGSASDFIPLIKYMTEDIYKKCVKALKGSDLEYFMKLYPAKGNSRISNISSETYTVDEYEEIKSVITDSTDLYKFSAFYMQTNNSLNNYKELYPRFGDNETYYLRDPYIKEHEAEALNSILEKYISGDRDDAYYLKLTGGDGEYDNISELYRKAGITADDAYDINAYTGCVSDLSVPETEASKFYRKSDYERLIDAISDEWSEMKFKSFYTLKNFASDAVIEPEREKLLKEYFESNCPGISEDYRTQEEDAYYIMDFMVSEREKTQMDKILCSAAETVEWKKVLKDKTFKDSGKSSGYIFEESVHRVHITGIMTDAEDNSFGYSDKMTFGEAAEIICRFMSGMTRAY